MRTLLVSLLGSTYNALPARVQRAALWLGHTRFLVGVVGIGVDGAGRLVLGRHRFGSPAWRFLGGMLDKGEDPPVTLAREIAEELGLAVTVGPLLAAGNGRRWAHVEVVYAYRVWDPLPEGSNDELLEVRSFPADDLPPMRPEHLWLVERHAPAAVAWAVSARRESP